MAATALTPASDGLVAELRELRRALEDLRSQLTALQLENAALRRQLADAAVPAVDVPLRRRGLSVPPYEPPPRADLLDAPISPTRPLSSPDDRRDRLDAEALLRQDEELAALATSDVLMSPPPSAGFKRPTDPTLLTTPEKEKQKLRRSASVGAARHE